MRESLLIAVHDNNVVVVAREQTRKMRTDGVGAGYNYLDNELLG